MRQCLFCPNPADSKEHIWPAWILESVKIRRPIRHSIGSMKPVIIPKPELKIKWVCSSCNQGWMSALESANIPLLGSMIQNIATPLDAGQQESIAVWTMKTAMVLDAVDQRTRNLFYTPEEREKLSTSSTIPTRTMIWLGRFYQKSLGLFGTNICLTINGVSKAAHGQVTTIVIGHLAIQSLTVHTNSEYSGMNLDIGCKDAPWDKSLTTVWPTSKAHWPPPLTFTNRGDVPIAALMDRWRISDAV